MGNKRNEISDDQIKEITRIFGEFKESQYCKIFDNDDFGFHKITVERPLRLNFMVNDERIDNMKSESGFLKLAESKKKGAAAVQEIEEGRALQNKIIEILKTMDSTKLYKNRNEFVKVLRKAFRSNRLDFDASSLKTLLSALSERDETADICTDSKGRPEPDADLRDTENVPLKEDIYAYFEREVKPHIPDAWIDEDKTKVGYEIPFTRHFYKYQSLRPSEEVLKEIIALEESIREQLKKVIGNGL